MKAIETMILAAEVRSKELWKQSEVSQDKGVRHVLQAMSVAEQAVADQLRLQDK